MATCHYFSHLKSKDGSYQETGWMCGYLGKHTFIYIGLLLVIVSFPHRDAYTGMNFLNLVYIDQHNLNDNVRYLNYARFCI